MSKNVTRTPSVSERRRQEELRRQKVRQRNLIIGGALLGLAVVIALLYFLTRDNTPTGTEVTGERPLAALDPAERNGYYDSPPEMTIDNDKEYTAVIRMADGGEMRLNLFDEQAPETVNNFVFLANQGFYDGTTFHRVLENFMAQGGDPTGTGTGGPGYEFASEIDPSLSFDRRGILAMANAGPDTNGSQFFITFDPVTRLDGGYTIFGELIEGDDVLSNISLRDPDTATEPGDVIDEIVIVEN